jgi:hypothetical protein
VLADCKEYGTKIDKILYEIEEKQKENEQETDSNKEE